MSIFAKQSAVFSQRFFIGSHLHINQQLEPSRRGNRSAATAMELRNYLSTRKSSGFEKMKFKNCLEIHHLQIEVLEFSSAVNLRSITKQNEPNLLEPGSQVSNSASSSPKSNES
jgi:hypothetical protein